MNRTPFQLIGLEQCTIESQYRYAETITAPVVEGNLKPEWNVPSRIRRVDREGTTVSVPFPSPESTVVPSDRVTIRVRDLAQGLRAMAASELAWIEDLGDDPIVITSDFYEVFMICQQVRRAG